MSFFRNLQSSQCHKNCLSFYLILHFIIVILTTCHNCQLRSSNPILALSQRSKVLLYLSSKFRAFQQLLLNLHILLVLLNFFAQRISVVIALDDESLGWTGQGNLASAPSSLVAFFLLFPSSLLSLPWATTSGLGLLPSSLMNWKESDKKLASTRVIPQMWNRAFQKLVNKKIIGCHFVLI